MAVEIFKLEDGAVRSTHIEPHDLQNHLDNGWVLETPKTEEKREKLTFNQGNKPR